MPWTDNIRETALASDVGSTGSSIAPTITSHKNVNRLLTIRFLGRINPTLQISKPVFSLRPDYNLMMNRMIFIRFFFNF
jgi:hypothetical protein